MRWGTSPCCSASVASYLVYLVIRAPIWMALAQVGAWINLFNLLPVWQLDGAHAYKALSRRQRWIIAAVLGTTWFFTTEGLLIIIGLAAVWRAWGTDAPDEGVPIGANSP